MFLDPCQGKIRNYKEEAVEEGEKVIRLSRHFAGRRKKKMPNKSAPQDDEKTLFPIKKSSRKNAYFLLQFKHRQTGNKISRENKDCEKLGPLTRAVSLKDTPG